MDHAATTPVRPEVVEAMLPYFSERFGNPSSLYALAREAKEAVEEARGRVATAIGAEPEEVYFTSGGTEADNWAIRGMARERGRRAGTENVPGIVGMGRAIDLATADIGGHSRRLAAMRDRLIRGILDTIPDTRLNGHPTERLANNVNVSFSYVEGESILLLLDAHGVAASTGSACTSASLEPSHVLVACGLPHEEAHGSLRLTLGPKNTDEDIDYVLSVLPGIIGRLRAISPLRGEA